MAAAKTGGLRGFHTKVVARKKPRERREDPTLCVSVSSVVQRENKHAENTENAEIPS